ncbi:Ig-like domain-containing protein [Microbacterium sp. 18062]|uniref:Ig-like domain-containing protein n=1 Tax=Microbacterium sp. 18062 TaxID=2681410 RepID=UPI001358A78E|nr:Ig-like domain-containing protein [Microbacterium sp. 18062]
MANGTDGPRISRRAWVVSGAITAAVALVATLAVVWPGFDAQQTPPDDGSIWAIQSGEGRRYARVNTTVGEIDTVKQVENPSGVVQNTDRLLVYAEGDTRFADVDMATPVDLDSEAEDTFQNTPAGTVSVVSEGDVIAYLTDGGSVYSSSLTSGASTVVIDPYADVETEEDEDRPTFVATAIAVGTDGVVYAYSAAENRVIRADAADGRVLGSDTVSEEAGESVQLSAAGDGWALLATESGEMWVRGRSEALTSGTTGGVLQRATSAGDVVYVADATGLVAVPRDGSAPERVEDTAQGVPAAPAELAGTVYAAWLPEGGASGTLWASDRGAADLDYGGSQLGDEVAPEFIANGARMILNETRSGWVWTLPDGALVPTSQQWDTDDEQPSVQQDEVEAERVIDPKPPVAVDDAFGVRAGRSVVLPVLLNDHDPNEDVLSIVAASLEGLDPAFGLVSTTNEQQELVVQVSPDASGSATFRYRITDGTTTDGLTSEAATVTLTVMPGDAGSAPVWCGVEGCLSTWPTPQVVPGGTVSVNVLEGWVDPDGDPLYVSSAINQSGVGSLALDPQGTVTFQHPNPNATEAQSILISVTVSDARGQSSEKPLEISVTPSPQLTAQSFAVVGTAGAPTTIDVRPHVSGVDGGLSIRSANAIDENSADIAVNSVAGTFQFTAAAAGSYIVQYVVADQVTEATGTVRVTLVDPAQTQISTPPLTAFVRPGEDATIDVVSAVSNPAGLVLLASDVRTTPDAAAILTVDLVGQSLLRVAGATDNGQPGVLGVVSYTISDGTGNGYTTTTGEVTVVLLPAAQAEPPIAVDDAVTVRAGTQIDIPVLDNDTAPAGALFAIDASTVANDSGDGLAFATGRLLRYLAPDEPGTYVLGYTIYRMGFPDMTDTAQVSVTVLPNEANAAPVPRTLVGRVLSGATVSIPFDRFAVDPDGDAVALDRIVAQPDRGSATVSPEGDAIVYTSAAGDSGQVTFVYQVRDSQGATGTAEVRVGVLDAESDPSPVTYSDYLQVQAGEGAEAVVRPADNDIDPSGSDLEVIDVRPNAEVGSAEYRAMEGMLHGIDENEVSLLSGAQLGTYSFAYTVRNGNGDTAIGLIVLKVVRDPVPDYPVVRDTTLTIESREDFPDGVDVLGGKVSWSAGDASSLTLSLWGEHPGIEVDGRRISGRIPDKTLLIPFQVDGISFDGREVTSYGFLRVPGTDDLQLTLRGSAATVQVDERGSVEFDLERSVALPPRSQIEVDGSRISVGGARAEAGCALVAGTTVRYTAGAGAPWADSCTVPVRLVGQEDYTFLTVHVEVIAEDPQPELRPASLTVSPGSSSTYDLTDMTTWAGTEDWAALSYALGYTGDQFTVTQAGTQVTVTAKDASRPGRQEPVTVTLPSHRDTRPSTLALTVGPAPSTLPKGATLTQQCSQSAGSSCTINVIGAGGEINPLPGTPLRLVSVGAGAGGNCTGVSFSVASATALQASWAADAEGTRCTVSFTVEDAQGRQSSGDRDGQVTLDLQGFPKAPNNVTQTAFGDRSITLKVDAGPAANAYPALQGFRIFDGSQQVTTCTAAGACQPFQVGANGEQRTYEARAYNAVGDSRAGVSVRAWAYRSPTVGQVTAEPIYVSGRTSNDSGVVRIRIQNSDPEVRSYEVTGANGPVSRGRGDYTELEVQLPVGSANITVTPTSNHAAPDGSGSVGSAGRASVNVAGLPKTGGVSVQTEAQTSITVSDAPLDRNGSSRSSEIVYVAVRAGNDFSCSVGSDGTGLRVSGGETSSSRTISGLEENREYTVGACVSNGFGAAKTGTANGWAWAPPAAPSSATYEIRKRTSGGSVTYLVEDQPSVPSLRDFEVVFGGWPNPAIGSEGSMTAKYCLRGTNQSKCGDERTIAPADPTRALQARLEGAGVGSSCVVGSTLRATAGQSPSGLGTVAIDPDSVQYWGGFLGWERVQPADPDQPLVVPNGARQVRADVTFTWTHAAAQYGVETFGITADCTGSVEPEPEPEPTETDDTTTEEGTP